MTQTALDYIKDSIAWEDLHAIGQCIVLVDEAGHHDIAMKGADDMMKISKDMNNYIELHRLVIATHESHEAIMKLIKMITGKEY